MRLTPRVLVSLIVLLLACVPSALHAQTLAGFSRHDRTACDRIRDLAIVARGRHEC